MSFKSIFGITPQKLKPTRDGGLARKMINKTGAVSVKGVAVSAHGTVDMAVELVPVGEPDAIGVFLESGVADGAEAWVVTMGTAYVYFVGSTTRGHLARTMLSSDTTPVAGGVLSEAIPTAPFATDKHFCEIGHVLQSRVGAGLALVNLHFN